MLTFETTHGAYAATLSRVSTGGEMVRARGLPTLEITDYSFGVESPTCDHIVTADGERNVAIARYTAAEFDLYSRCEDRADEFAKASSFWAQIANPDGTVNSAYGKTLFCDEERPNGQTAWGWAADCLTRDLQTRQATLLFHLPRHEWRGNRDVPCTMYGQFLHRRGKLHLYVYMRSNDVVRGLVYDMPWFCHLLLTMAERLQVEVGHYHHHATSMHVYTKDLELVRRMLG